jgi:signal transduction histidine kinase
MAHGYRDRLEYLATIADAPDVAAGPKTSTLQKLLSQFPGLVAIRFVDQGHELLALYDDGALAEASLTRVDLEPALRDLNPPVDPEATGGIMIVNSTVVEKLPTLTAYVRHARDDGRPPLEVSAVVRLEDFQRIAARSEAVGIYIKDAHGMLLAARDPGLPARKERASWHPTLEGGAAVVREYTGAQGVMIGGLAPSRAGGISAVAELPRSAAYVASRHLLQRLVLVALGLLMVAAVVATIWARRITRSIARLAEAAREIGHGHFDANVEVESRDEIGALATSFNQMATELDTRERALKTAQAALIQSEKMAAFGQLGAGIAHEVKNPLAGIQGIVQLALRQTDTAHPLREPLTIVEKETKRCRAIIDNLLKFARQEKTVHQATDVGKVIEDSAAIMNHQLAIHGVQIERDVAPNLPKIAGNANQLQQVLMNLILNADQAFEGKPGVVRLEAAPTPDGGVEMRVRDNGPGIPEAIRVRIFEPFFTTKPAGAGTGLGLSVSCGIIKDHQGRIEVASNPGQGTTFTITLPPLAGARLGSTVAASEPIQKAA